MVDEKSGHGGAREGAGRKPLAEDERRVRLPVYLPESEREAFSDWCEQRNMAASAKVREWIRMALEGTLE